MSRSAGNPAPANGLEIAATQIAATQVAAAHRRSALRSVTDALRGTAARAAHAWHGRSLALRTAKRHRRAARHRHVSAALASRRSRVTDANGPKPPTLRTAPLWACCPDFQAPQSVDAR
eukprot:7057810-Pyramimonas_sp.AAC.1